MSSLLCLASGELFLPQVPLPKPGWCSAAFLKADAVLRVVGHAAVSGPCWGWWAAAQGAQGRPSGRSRGDLVVFGWSRGGPARGVRQQDGVAAGLGACTRLPLTLRLWGERVQPCAPNQLNWELLSTASPTNWSHASCGSGRATDLQPRGFVPLQPTGARNRPRPLPEGGTHPRLLPSVPPGPQPPGRGQAGPDTPREAADGPNSPQRGRLPLAAIFHRPPSPLAPPPAPPRAPLRRAAGSPVRAAASRGLRRRAWRFQDGGGAGAGGVRRERVVAAARASSPLPSPAPAPRPAAGGMLRSTGYFRGIDCPFLSAGGPGPGGGSPCRRPYCHFRHPPVAAAAAAVRCGASGGPGAGLALGHGAGTALARPGGSRYLLPFSLSLSLPGLWPLPALRRPRPAVPPSPTPAAACPPPGKDRPVPFLLLTPARLSGPESASESSKSHLLPGLGCFPLKPLSSGMFSRGSVGTIQAGQVGPACP